ncbi:PEP-CTERM sorting domain-containing protein [Methylomagnum sp.]
MIQTTAPIPLGAATLSFFLEIPAIDSPSDFLKVFVDGTEVFSINATAVMAYMQQSVDISAFADGAPHVLSFQSTTISANGNVSNFFVDDVDITAVPASVPEPSTLALFGIAALGLAARRRTT